jgi:hypothetical protein
MFFLQLTIALALGCASILAVDIPGQVHIALAGTKSELISVVWNTKQGTTKSIVKYGTESNVYEMQSVGSSASYYETFNHKVLLQGPLVPSTMYYYMVGDDVSGWSKEFSFRSPPQDSSITGNFTFAVFADLGVVNGDPSNDYITSIKDDISLVWHGGDASYADDTFLHKGCALKFCYEDAQDTYLENTEVWASSIPYMLTPGNHEADCHDPACLSSKDRREKLSNFTAYNARYRMPSAESGGVENMHYSFDYNNVHFISLDTATGYPGAPQETRYIMPCGGFGDMLTWLEIDLIEANKNREVRPWIFAQGHHPMYQGDTVDRDFQKAMEDLFFKYGVDVYFCGHIHSYERDYPVYREEVEKTYVNPKATTYIMIGGAGNDEMRGNIQLDRSSDPTSNLRGKEESDGYGPWTALTDKDNHVGIGLVHIVDGSTMRFDYVRTMTGDVFDSITLTRDHSVYADKKV